MAGSCTGLTGSARPAPDVCWYGHFCMVTLTSGLRRDGDVAVSSEDLGSDARASDLSVSSRHDDT